MTLVEDRPAESPAPATTTPSLLVRASRLAGRHWIFLLLLVGGLALRAVTTFAYRPAFMFFGDSFAYIIGAQRFQPANDRPFGYSALLRAVSNFGDLSLMIAVQHAVGLGLAIPLYVVLLRRGAAPWLAALVTTPLLLDAYVVQIEHQVLTESVFAALLTAAAFVATRRHHTLASAAVTGGLLAAAASTRTVAIPIAVLFVGYLAVRRVGWRPMVAFLAALIVPILAYMTWFASLYGAFATTDASGRFLYGRVAVFAECEGLSLTRNEAKLCDNADPSLRPNANFYVWAGDSPLRSLGLSGPETDEVAASFSRKVILDQPLTYAKYVIGDTAHYFAPGRYLTRADSPDTPWRFPTATTTPLGSTSLAHTTLAGEPHPPTINAEAAAGLRAYQAVVFTQGPLLLLGFVLGCAGGLLDRSRRRFDGPFVALVGLSVVAIPSMTVMFDYRYGLPAIPLLAYAGGIGAIALIRRRHAKRLGPDDAPQDPWEPTQATRTPASGRRWLAVGAGVAVVGLIAAAPLEPQPTLERYVSMRAENGTLGTPLGEAYTIDDDIQVQRYTTGSIVSRGSSASVVPTRYEDAIDRLGGYSELGIPTNGEELSPYRSAERFLRLENGIIFWSRLDGTRAVTGRILDVWNPRSVQEDLREPLADAVEEDGITVQEFVGGTVTVESDGSLSIDLNDTPERPGADRR